jgi:hypothetical protein
MYDSEGVGLRRIETASEAEHRCAFGLARRYGCPGSTSAPVIASSGALHVTQERTFVREVGMSEMRQQATLPLFDHLVGTGQQGRRQDDSNFPSRLGVDRELKRCGLAERHFGGICAIQYLSHLLCGLANS